MSRFLTSAETEKPAVRCLVKKRSDPLGGGRIVWCGERKMKFQEKGSWSASRGGSLPF